VCRYLGERDRINHVHFRNVIVRKPYVDYTEVFLDEGQVNMFAVMKELVRQKYPRALYPEQDLGPAAERLRMFLEQYWGGPTTYSEQRGHPRLRLRHGPYAVTPAQRDRWLTHMLAALDSLGLAAEDDAELRDYLTRAAQFMVNSFDEE